MQYMCRLVFYQGHVERKTLHCRTAQALQSKQEYASRPKYQQLPPWSSTMLTWTNDVHRIWKPHGRYGGSANPTSRRSGGSSIPVVTTASRHSGIAALDQACGFKSQSKMVSGDFSWPGAWKRSKNEHGACIKRSQGSIKRPARAEVGV